MGDDGEKEVHTALQDIGRMQVVMCVWGKDGAFVLSGSDDECSNGSVIIPNNANTPSPILASAMDSKVRLRTDVTESSGGTTFLFLLCMLREEC